jgi:hypothetical protein
VSVGEQHRGNLRVHTEGQWVLGVLSGLSGRSPMSCKRETLISEVGGEGERGEDKGTRGKDRD